MNKDELLDDLVKHLSRRDDVASAGRVDGEDAIGIEMEDGAEFFLSLQSA